MVAMTSNKAVMYIVSRIFSDNPPLGKGSISKGDENSDTSQSKVLRDSKIFKNLVPNKVSGVACIPYPDIVKKM